MRRSTVMDGGGQKQALGVLRLRATGCSLLDGVSPNVCCAESQPSVRDTPFRRRAVRSSVSQHVVMRRVAS